MRSQIMMMACTQNNTHTAPHTPCRHVALSYYCLCHHHPSRCVMVVLCDGGGLQEVGVEEVGAALYLEGVAQAEQGNLAEAVHALRQCVQAEPEHRTS